MRVSFAFWLLIFFSAVVATAHDGQEHGPAAENRQPNDPAAKSFQFTIREGYRYVDSTGLPNHPTGRFPNRGNPNTIREQSYHFRVPLNPKIAETITPLRMQPFGIAINGIPFDPGAAEFWQGDPRSGWQYEALSGKINLGLDENHAHVQPNGAYHYHGLPTGLLKKNDQAKAEIKMVLLGYAADGFSIYGPTAYSEPLDSKSKLKQLKSSFQLRSGMRPSGPPGAYDGTFGQDWEYVAGSGDLDECNGRTGVTPDDQDATYYYVITAEYPFIPRNFRGTPDSSFSRRGPPGGPPGGPPPGRRPPPPPRRRPPPR